MAIYEKPIKPIECVGYDAKIIYMISGDLSVTVGKEKYCHLSPGQLIYIPAGVSYKLTWTG